MRPPPMQVRVDVPADATSMTMTYGVSVIPQPGWEPVGDVHVLVRAGAPTEFSYSIDEEERTTVEANPDQHLSSVDDGSLSVEVEPGSSVYLAFFNQGLHVTRVTDLGVTFETGGAGSSGGDPSGSESAAGDTSTGELAEPGTDTEADQGPSASGRGGGCRTDGSACGWWGLLFAMAPLRRRRQMR